MERGILHDLRIIAANIGSAREPAQIGSGGLVALR